MEMVKKIARFLIARIYGENVAGIDAIPISTGPLRGKLLLKQPGTEQLSMLFGRYERAVISAILQLAGTTRVAYDVGANIGYVSLALSQSMTNGGKVFAFEPVPGNVELLRKLVTLNNLQGRVIVIPLALGDKKGEQKLVMWGSSSMHLLETAVNGQDTDLCPSVVVEGTTIDAFVFEQNNPAPDLIKIDIEGAEALVLEGALGTLGTYSPAILMEIHGPTNARRVWDALDSLDYRWVKLTEQGPSTVATKEKLLRYFTKDYWTHHFLLTKG